MQTSKVFNETFDGGNGQIAMPSKDGPPEHQLPGYGAGFDAGFLAGILAASQGGAMPPPPGQDPVAGEGGAGASAPEPARPPFLALLEDFPDTSHVPIIVGGNRTFCAVTARKHGLQSIAF